MQALPEVTSVLQSKAYNGMLSKKISDFKCILQVIKSLKSKLNIDCKGIININLLDLLVIEGYYQGLFLKDIIDLVCWPRVTPPIYN